MGSAFSAVNEAQAPGDPRRPRTWGPTHSDMPLTERRNTLRRCVMGKLYGTNAVTFQLLPRRDCQTRYEQRETGLYIWSSSKRFQNHAKTTNWIPLFGLLMLIFVTVVRRVSKHWEENLFSSPSNLEKKIPVA